MAKVAVGLTFPECYNQISMGIIETPVAVGLTFPECYNTIMSDAQTLLVAVGLTFPECYNACRLRHIPFVCCGWPDFSRVLQPPAPIDYKTMALRLA